jgi:hypothetical protein
VNQWPRGELFDEKKQRPKISWHCPFKFLFQNLFLRADFSKWAFVSKVSLGKISYMFQAWIGHWVKHLLFFSFLPNFERDTTNLRGTFVQKIKKYERNQPTVRSTSLKYFGSWINAKYNIYGQGKTCGKYLYFYNLRECYLFLEL